MFKVLSPPRSYVFDGLSVHTRTRRPFIQIRTSLIGCLKDIARGPLNISICCSKATTIVLIETFECSLRSRAATARLDLN